MALGLPKFLVRKGRSCALKKTNPHIGMGIPKLVWVNIPNRGHPHTGLGIIPIWGAT
jgi:hypothetical protein